MTEPPAAPPCPYRSLQLDPSRVVLYAGCHFKVLTRAQPSSLSLHLLAQESQFELALSLAQAEQLLAAVNLAEGPFPFKMQRLPDRLTLSCSIPDWQHFLAYWLAIAPQLALDAFQQQ